MSAKFNFQPNINFNSVDEFLDYLPKEERELVEHLRSLVFGCIPNSIEKLAYNVPFYYGKRRICYIWPSSVPWGKTPLNGVQLGFTQGFQLQDELEYLDKGNRKQVYVKVFHSISEIDDDMVRTLLFNASEIDQKM